MVPISSSPMLLYFFCSSSCHHLASVHFPLRLFLLIIHVDKPMVSFSFSLCSSDPLNHCLLLETPSLLELTAFFPPCLCIPACLGPAALSQEVAQLSRLLQCSPVIRDSPFRSFPCIPFLSQSHRCYLQIYLPPMPFALLVPFPCTRSLSSFPAVTP